MVTRVNDIRVLIANMRRDYIPERRSSYQDSSCVVMRSYTQLTRIYKITGRSSDHSIGSEKVSFHEQASRNVAIGRSVQRPGRTHISTYALRIAVDVS